MPDLPPRPVLDGAAEVNPNDFEQWNRAKIIRDGLTEQVNRLEAVIREQAGNAKYLTVNGEKVAVRVIQDAIGVTFRKDFYQRTRSHD